MEQKTGQFGRKVKDSTLVNSLVLYRRTNKRCRLCENTARRFFSFPITFLKHYLKIMGELF